MATFTDRRLRADAARNAERIVAAARSVYAEVGPDASIEAIARSAGVGERTLYRRFPTRADLLQAALDSRRRYRLRDKNTTSWPPRDGRDHSTMTSRYRSTKPSTTALTAHRGWVRFPSSAGLWSC
jgi:AcrR family transcriptional regulator